MGGLSKPRLGSKRGSRSLRLRPGMQSDVFRNSIRNGSRRLVPMKASKASSKPIELMRAKPRDEFPNCRAPASVPAHLQGIRILARGPERDFVVMERATINRIGSETGCHTCGTMNPGTPLNNFVLDHQPPSAWNPLGRPQRLYPQCLSCSSKQGNWISRNGGRR